MYRTKNVFDGGSGGVSGASCTRDDVMQVACNALGQEQHPEVQHALVNAVCWSLVSVFLFGVEFCFVLAAG